MPIPSRRNLASFFEEFAAQHRGVRPGRMFGLPALYAGRRMFACLVEDGLIVRLPEDDARRALKDGAQPYSRRGGKMGAWVRYGPRNTPAVRCLIPMLETAARHVARFQTEELTGVKLS